MFTQHSTQYNPAFKSKLDYNFQQAIEDRGQVFEHSMNYPMPLVCMDFQMSIFSNSGFSSLNPPFWLDIVSSDNRSMSKARWKKLYGEWRKYIKQTNY